MTSVTSTNATEIGENAILRPHFLQVVECANRRTDHQNRLRAYAASDYSSETSEHRDTVRALVTAIEAEEKSLLSTLTELLSVVERALRQSSASTSALDLIRAFEPFRVAKLILDHQPQPGEYYCIITSFGEGTAEYAEGNIYDVVFVLRDGHRVWRVADVAADLLQYWEIFLRNQTSLECTAFCLAVRKYLHRRVSATVLNDALVALLPSAISAASVSSPEAEASRKDIQDRLTRIFSHLKERERRRSELEHFTGRDLDPKTKRHKEFRHIAGLYRDEESSLLSELVHLHDNMKKWLRVRGRPMTDIALVERMRPYRIAGCVVNTLKHGIRGRRKKNATWDVDAIIVSHSGNEGVPENDRIVDVRHMINYDGDLVSAAQLIEDLAHLWELFLRNHTDLDTSEFRRVFGALEEARVGMVTKVFALPEGLEAEARKTAAQLKALDID